ncbi:MAG: lipid-binding SYLF domain-containing protein [Planctomycetota bacterium]|jgi:lipid-binding SYLF domain-containing protein
MTRMIGILVLALVVAAGCKSAGGTTPEEKRADVRTVRDSALAELYKLKASAKAEVENAPGYAVFTNYGLNLFILASGNGFGAVTNNKTKKITYMKMQEYGVGIGLGAKDFRIVIVFNDEKVMNDFVNSGWDFGGDADAAAKTEESGGAAAGQASTQGMTIYQLTDQGLALQATVMGTKYYKDDELN